MKQIILPGRAIGPEDPCLVIVDAGVNHNNVPERAFELIRSAARAGADVVKFQTYSADAITTKTAPRYWSSHLDTDKGGTQYDTFKRLDSLPLETYTEMVEVCKKEGVIFSSTPFDLKSARFLEKLGTELYKISSSDVTYHQLLKTVAETQMPIILSTGTASIREIENAIRVIQKTGNDNIVLQHCMLSYPCRTEDANLVKMQKLMGRFHDIPVGYSDHTEGLIVPFAAVAMGAKSIEKHYTIDKKLPDSPDHSFSLTPDELQQMVEGIRTIEKSMGTFIDGHYPAEEKAYKFARKSVVSAVPIPKGIVIKETMLTCKRPGTGIYPEHLEELVGKTARADIAEDTVITWEMVQ
jgi:sialic acid synthase SpsE